MYNSVANQKKLLQKYAKENDFTNTKFYVDDGYTGTNFNRPGFQQMIDDIEMGYITTVIVKEQKLSEQSIAKTNARTQSVVIHYKFIGELDMPENFDKIKVNTS